MLHCCVSQLVFFLEDNSSFQGKSGDERRGEGFRLSRFVRFESKWVDEGKYLRTNESEAASRFICERIPSRSMIYLRCRVRKCASRLATIRLNFVNSKVFEREGEKRAYRCENVFQCCSGEKLFTRNGWSIFSALIVEILITCRILFCLIVQEAIDKTSRWNVVKWNVLSLTSSNRSLHLTLPRFSSTLTAARVSKSLFHRYF